MVTTLRTKQYSAGNYKNIVIFSAPRTGSSLTYNIFRFLFESDSDLLTPHNNFDLDHIVLKTHRFDQLELIDKKNTLCVFTFRNPINACISHFRVCLHNPIYPRKIAKEFIQKHSKYFLITEKNEKEGQCTLRMKYENFADNLDYIFDAIEDHFQISIDPLDKALISKSYSKENIQANIENLKEFKEFLPISGFHGTHITPQEYRPSREFFDWLNIYLEDEKAIFQNYGYFSD
jgi:hypothetical protein